MPEISSVEREPLVTTVPAVIGEVTRWLVSAYDGPLAIRGTREEATRLCEDAERDNHDDGEDIEFVWHPADPAGDDGPEKLYATFCGDEVFTEYTVAPITVRIGH